VRARVRPPRAVLLLRRRLLVAARPGKVPPLRWDLRRPCCRDPGCRCPGYRWSSPYPSWPGSGRFRCGTRSLWWTSVQQPPLSRCPPPAPPGHSPAPVWRRVGCGPGCRPPPPAPPEPPARPSSLGRRSGCTGRRLPTRPARMPEPGPGWCDSGRFLMLRRCRRRHWRWRRYWRSRCRFRYASGRRYRSVPVVVPPGAGTAGWVPAVPAAAGPQPPLPYWLHGVVLEVELDDGADVEPLLSPVADWSPVGSAGRSPAESAG
jgi:hypothetical protein